jgi:hypothetical protein
MTGDAWVQDGGFGRFYDFTGEDGELPIALHALTPAYVRSGWRRPRFFYMAVQYRGAGVRIWRRALDLWDTLASSIAGAIDLGVPRFPI